MRKIGRIIGKTMLITGAVISLLYTACLIVVGIYELCKNGFNEINIFVIGLILALVGTLISISFED